MSEYRKGRVLVLVGLLGFSTVSVLAGTAGADKGTIKTQEVGATNNGQDPHLDTACIGVDMTGFPTAPTSATFELVSPTKGGDPVTVSSADQYDLRALIGSTEAGPQGYHIKVTVNGKHKTFWVKDGTKGCAEDPPSGPVTF